MKRKILSIWTVILTTLLLIPLLVLAHGDEDHGENYHIEIMHVMKNGFHGKLEERVVEVVLAPDVELEKKGNSISITELSVGDMVFVQGTKMPGDKIGASRVVVDDSMLEEHKSTEDQDKREKGSNNIGHRDGGH